MEPLGTGQYYLTVDFPNRFGTPIHTPSQSHRTSPTAAGLHSLSRRSWLLPPAYPVACRFSDPMARSRRLDRWAASSLPIGHSKALCRRLEWGDV